jgi:hypothetical protein
MTPDMSAENENKTESCSWTPDWTWLVWMAVAVLVCLLSSGPVIWLAGRGYFRPGYPLGGTVNQVVLVVYKPVALAYNHTILHKPIGLYLHLWAPILVDRKGNTIP